METARSSNIGKPLLVCGSIHINVIAKAKGGSSLTEKHGDVIFDIGGTANNIAIAAKKLGIPVRLMTALPKKSPFTNIITAHLENAEIEHFIQYESNLPDAAYCTLMESSGKFTSVSSTPIELVKLYRDTYEPAMEGVSGCILDSTLSSEMIAHITRYANKHDVPVFICATSEEKSEKLAGLEVQFAGVFANHKELNRLAKKIKVNSTAPALANYFNCPVIVTYSEDGAILAHPDNHNSEHFDAVYLGEASGKDYLGAGDILAAHTVIHGLYGRRSIKEAVQLAMSAAEEEAINRHLDISEDGGKVNHALQAINNAATIDHLTGLPNRATAVKKMEQLQERNAPFLVALIDVDFFKKVNDTFGHDEGDRALELVSSTIFKTMRESDFCARWGGEEFLCIIGRGIDNLHDAKVVMERARKAVESISWSHGKLTVSIGVAQSNGDFAMAIKRADIALYQSKNNGRNQTSICQ